MRHLLPNMDFRYYYTNNSLMANNNFKVIFTFYLLRDSVSHQEQKLLCFADKVSKKSSFSPVRLRISFKRERKHLRNGLER